MCIQCLRRIRATPLFSHPQFTIPRLALPPLPAQNRAAVVDGVLAVSIPPRIIEAPQILNSRVQIPLDRRPDIVDLAGADYDTGPGERANKTLVICSAPRTGSYELCRFALAAGLGIPFEYIHPQFASQLGPRWGLPPDPLQGAHV